MAKDSKGSRSILHLLFWEGLAAAGLIYHHRHPLADSFWEITFRYNALFFLVAYPILYVSRWQAAEGCLGMILWPLSFILSLALGVSAYLWAAFMFHSMGNPFFFAMTQHERVLGVLFIFIYFPLIQPLWGIGKSYYPLGKLVWVLFYSALGGLLGFLLGRFVIQKFGTSLTADSGKFLLWLSLTLLGTAIGALAARRGGKE